MPMLANIRHERFAWARSEGMLLEEAYERAGYVPDRGHASRLAAREDVRERIFELRANQVDVLVAERPRVIDALMALSRESRSLQTAEGAREARLALLDAARLQIDLARDRRRDRNHLRRELTRAGTPADPAAEPSPPMPGPARPLRIA